MRSPVLFLLLFFACSTYAQRIINFNLFPGSSGVVVRFTIAGGTSCTGFSILHSLDSLSYSTVGTDNTPCNSSANEERSFTHASPAFNQMNYYKVQLDPYVETTPPKGVFASPTGNVSMLVYPNPVYTINDPVTMKILSVDNVRLVGYLYNQFGNRMQALDVITNKGLAPITVATYDDGVYVIWLTDGSQVFSCKFIIFR